MIRITKRCVTFNKYARNFNFHNEMKAAITRSHSHVALCLPQLHETHQAYKMKSVTRKRCSLRYTYTRNCGSTKEIILTPHKKTDVPRYIFCTNLTTPVNRTTGHHPATRSVFSTICNSRPVIDPCRYHGDHVTSKRDHVYQRLEGEASISCRRQQVSGQSLILVGAGNTCFSLQSLVHVITFRCHFFVAHSVYPTFTGLLPTFITLSSAHVPIPPILRASTTVVCYKGTSVIFHTPCRHGNTPVADGSCAGGHVGTGLCAPSHQNIWMRWEVALRKCNGFYVVVSVTISLT